MIEVQVGFAIAGEAAPPDLAQEGIVAHPDPILGKAHAKDVAHLAVSTIVDHDAHARASIVAGGDGEVRDGFPSSWTVSCTS